MEKLGMIITMKRVSKTLYAMPTKKYSVVRDMLLSYGCSVAPELYDKLSVNTAYYSYALNDENNEKDLIDFIISFRKDLLKIVSIDTINNLNRNDYATIKDYVFAALVDYCDSWTAGG